MTDYTQNEDYSAKDALATLDPEKLILGTDIDSELAEIQTAIASKYDVSDLASQAQAEAGTNNTTLMTPLRVSQFLVGSGGAGIVPDLQALADPGDDRIVYWDESADTTTWLDIGTGLEITAGSVLNVVTATVDHDTLLNFVSDEHIAHSGVIPTAGVGIALTLSGTGIEAAFDYALDINALTEETTIDAAADDIAFYDNSAATIRKVPIDVLVGDELGDGAWFRNTTQSIGSALATAIFNTEASDNLTRGTYSTSTGVYTNGTAASRIWVHGRLTVGAQAAGDDANIQIQVNGSVKAEEIVTNRGSFGASTSVMSVTAMLSLAAGDTVRIQMKNTTTKTLSANQNWFSMLIMELG